MLPRYPENAALLTGVETEDQGAVDEDRVSKTALRAAEHLPAVFEQRVVGMRREADRGAFFGFHSRIPEASTAA